MDYIRLGKYSIDVTPLCQWPAGVQRLHVYVCCTDMPLGERLSAVIRREEAPGCEDPFCRVCAGLEAPSP